MTAHSRNSSSKRAWQTPATQVQVADDQAVVGRFEGFRHFLLG